jgi:two-component system sensor histidine kinase UhpB
MQQKFQALNEAAREGIFDCNLATLAAHINDKMRFFLPSNDSHISNFFEISRGRIHPDDLPMLTHEYKQLINSDRRGCQVECRLLGLDNKYYNVISSMHILRDDASGKPYRLIGTLLDISELRTLQAQEYEQRLHHKQELTASIILAQENERNRWAEELHDNVCQLLTVAKLYMDQMTKRTDTVTTLLPEATSLVRDAMTEIRQLSATIKPPSFLETSLKQAIRKLASDINRVKEITFSFIFSVSDETLLTDEQKLLAYRVVQEQLNNIVKYADAKKVEIMLHLRDGQFIISVKDDGNGFDPKVIKTGIGLRNIQSRLQHYHGNMQIASAEGEGCTLEASFEVAEVPV